MDAPDGRGVPLCAGAAEEPDWFWVSVAMITQSVRSITVTLWCRIEAVFSLYR
jgi:hypothetical protein